jgi:tol-pal system beta propeller repeat protein TolB
MSSSKREQLTRDGRAKMDLVFLRDGAELIYTLLENVTQLSLMRLKLADRTSERLHPSAIVSEVEAAFTPDGRSYTFLQIRKQLVIRDTNKNKDVQLASVGLRRPSIAPDGSRVIFSMPAANGLQIQSVNNEGQDRQSLTQRGFNSWPAFSPDGKLIAFGLSLDGNYDIYVMDADGSNRRRLTNSPGLDMRPAWSPDGRHIAFTSNRDGHYQIYVMNADGSEQRRVTNHPERDDFPTWHPDGKRLAIVSEQSGKFDLYLVDVPL